MEINSKGKKMNIGNGGVKLEAMQSIHQQPTVSVQQFNLEDCYFSTLYINHTRKECIAPMHGHIALRLTGL